MDISDIERLQMEERDRKQQFVCLIENGSVTSPMLSQLRSDVRLAQFDFEAVKQRLDLEGSTWRVFAAEQSAEKSEYWRTVDHHAAALDAAVAEAERVLGDSRGIRGG